MNEVNLLMVESPNDEPPKRGKSSATPKDSKDAKNEKRIKLHGDFNALYSQLELERKKNPKDAKTFQRIEDMKVELKALAEEINQIRVELGMAQIEFPAVGVYPQ